MTGDSTVADVPLRIDPAEARAFVAYRDPRAEVSARDLAAAIAAVSSVIRPRLVWRTFPVATRTADALTLGGGPRFRIPGIGTHWGAVAAVVAGLATIGEEVEGLVRARREAGDVAGALLCDSTASAAVECLAEWANDRLCQLGLAEGLRVTNRISPGLAGWDLDGHRALVGLVPADVIGVCSRDDGTVAPAKTISFLVGIGPDARTDHYFVQCRRCWAEACAARRMAAAASVSQ